MPETTFAVNIDLAPVLATSAEHFANERPIDCDEALLLEALAYTIELKIERMMIDWKWHLENDHHLVSEIERKSVRLLN